MSRCCCSVSRLHLRLRCLAPPACPACLSCPACPVQGALHFCVPQRLLVLLAHPGVLQGTAAWGSIAGASWHVTHYGAGSWAPAGQWASEPVGQAPVVGAEVWSSCGLNVGLLHPSFACLRFLCPCAGVHCASADLPGPLHRDAWGWAGGCRRQHHAAPHPLHGCQPQPNEARPGHCRQPQQARRRQRRAGRRRRRQRRRRQWQRCGAVQVFQCCLARQGNQPAQASAAQRLWGRHECTHTHLCRRYSLPACLLGSLQPADIPPVAAPCSQCLPFP